MVSIYGDESIIRDFFVRRIPCQVRINGYSIYCDISDVVVSVWSDREFLVGTEWDGDSSGCDRPAVSLCDSDDWICGSGCKRG